MKKQYKLSFKCPNAECWNLNEPSTIWCENQTTNHPCGVCGTAVEVLGVLEEMEVPEEQVSYTPITAKYTPIEEEPLTK